MQCGLPDVEALLGHLDRAPEAWRAATRSACEALHAAILEASFTALLHSWMTPKHQVGKGQGLVGRERQ